MSLVYVDGDPIVYRCGFASEVHSYELVVRTDAAGLEQVVFSPTPNESAGDAMKKWLAAMEGVPGFEVLNKEKLVKAQPLQFALEATKAQITSILDETKAKHVKLFLSEGTNYRFKIATQRPYKGNREGIPKPVHYGAIRDYLTQYWGAIAVHQIEADDRISIDARAGVGAIIATIDKDLDQIPGRHYNYMKKVFYDVDETEAELFFYQQVLSGDATDNIPGCYKVGNVKAQALVLDIYDTHQNDAGGWAGPMWDRIVHQYRLSAHKEGCPYTEEQAPAVALETARLVRLQEYDGQLWCPPGQPDEFVTEALYG